MNKQLTVELLKNKYRKDAVIAFIVGYAASPNTYEEGSKSAMSKLIKDGEDLIDWSTMAIAMEELEGLAEEE